MIVADQLSEKKGSLAWAGLHKGFNANISEKMRFPGAFKKWRSTDLTFWHFGIDK